MPLIRHVLFSVCGGYSMTSFYNDSVRLGREAEKKYPNRKKNSGTVWAWWGPSQPPTTFTQDIRETIIENEVMCALALAAMVLAGGFPALLGGFASFLLEGPDGPARYMQIRDTYRDVIEGNF
jgi:hypothetical protein